MNAPDELDRTADETEAWSTAFVPLEREAKEGTIKPLAGGRVARLTVRIRLLTSLR